MEFLELYNEENKDILYSMSWLNKNSIFDKSVGNFTEIDLFTFLENIEKFDYNKDLFYDDIYYILEYTKDSILHLINNINKEIKREHKIVPIAQAKEFDKKTIVWLSRQDGRNIKEKLKNNKIKAVKRYENVDTYENRIFKIFLKKLILVDEVRSKIDRNDFLIGKIRQWLRSDDAKNINEYGNIVYNNILLHHPHYSKIFKSYKWINRLDEKVKKYTNSYAKQIKIIVKFEILKQLQFSTTTIKVLPSTLNNDTLNNFDIKINNCLIKIDLESYISKIQNNMIEKKLNFKSIKKFSSYVIENQIKIKKSQNRAFNINISNSETVYIDLFRLFPLCKVDNEIIQFPIMLKQNIDNQTVNANNTKIINLNHEFYTLPEILKTYDTNMLRYFLEDFKKYFQEVPLNYIIPDYVNIFEFSQVKKTIKSYFPSNRNIPKSILAGLEYLFSGALQENDTLICIQKDHNNDLFATPLLIKFDEQLKSITDGLYIEKHPTKKLLKENDTLDELNKYFDVKQSKNLLNKFLQNGIKGIKQQQIAFFFNNEIIYLKNVNNPTIKNRNLNVKKIFNNKNLFNKNIIDLKDTNEDNLKNFEKLLALETKGYILWKEHLPKLSMGNILMPKGYFDEFILVDEDSEVITGEIEVKNHFVIPASTKELTFPLIFGDENINFEAYINSNEMPFKENVECELKLTYNYEAETPYELTFIPINVKYKHLKVRWRAIQDKDYNNLPIPNYPPMKNWNELENFKNRDGSDTNLLEWIKNDFKKIIDMSCFYSEKCKSQRVYFDNINFDWWTDKKGLYASKVILDNIGEIFFHQNNFDKFDEKLHSFSFDMEVSDRGGYRAINVSSDKSLSQNTIKRLQKSIRFPLYTIWKDGKTLGDLNVPDEFRNLAFKSIQGAIYLLSISNIPTNLKNELLLFLSVINQDSDEKIFNTLLSFSKTEKTFNKYFEYFGYAIGCRKRKAQIELWKSLIERLNHMNEKVYSNSLKTIGIVIWRCEDIAYQLTEQEVKLILEKLYYSLDRKVREKNKFLQYNTKILRTSIVIRLELLLGILRSRLNNSKINKTLSPNNTLVKKYIQIIDLINKKIILENIKLNSRIELHIDKHESFKKTPDLLYALRMYLSGNIEATQSITVLGVSDD